MHLSPSILAVCLLGAPLASQSTSILVDLGTSGFPSNGGANTWNDVDETNQTVPITLIDWQGASTGIQWSIDTGFQGANSAGTTVPQPGSLLAEFPVSATRDVMYGSNQTTVIRLSQLSPNTTVDLVFAASRTNVADERTTDYEVQGFNGGIATLNPSNNTTQTVSVPNILADALGEIVIRVHAAASNTNSPTFYYYLGGVDLRTTTTPTRPQILAFDQPGLQVSRPQGAGVFSTPLTVIESTGATLAVSLSAIDQATSQTPTWLSLPANTVVGQAFSVEFDATSLAMGSYAATVTVSASGYPESTMRAELTVRDPDRKNLLFYGNSYSQGNLGVPTLVKYLIEEAGHPSPNVVSRLVGGQSLLYHLTNPTQASAITEAMPLGEQWDAVVMQGLSTEAANALGNPMAFRNNALAILTNVRDHSPGAVAVMYQTWARGPGSSVYPGTYPNPLAMHEDIRTNYQLAVADMNETLGAGAAFNAAAGDAVALLAFDPTLYTEDWSHPTPSTTLLAGSAIYQAIYRERVCDLAPNFAGGSNLANHVVQMGLDKRDWDALTGIAERVADIDVRRYPGSSEDLLLNTGVNGTPLACPVKSVGLNDTISVSMTTPNDVYGGASTLLLLDAFASGFPPGASLIYPEWQFRPSTVIVIAAQNPLGSGLVWNIPLTVTLPGFSLLFQGLAIGPSATRNNPIFTMTDAHELRLQ